MNVGTAVLSIDRLRKQIDWKLLVFLLLFLNVKLVVKLLAVFFIYIIQPGFRFGFRWTKSRLPLFYPAVILIGVLNYFLYSGFLDLNYSVGVLTGICFWVLCLLSVHQVKLLVEKNDVQVIYHTLIAFFILNASVSFGELFRIMIETGELNPYRYQGEYQKYFISTGDYIKGISFDTSTANAVMNAFGVVFFLFRKNYLMVLLCMSVLLLTGSNLTNAIMVISFILLLILRSDRIQKSILVICLFMMIVFLAKISPQNNQYVTDIVQRFIGEEALPQPDALANSTHKTDSTAEDKRKAIAISYLDSIRKLRDAGHRQSLIATETPVVFLDDKPVIPVDNIHTAPFQSRNDTTENRQRLIRLADDKGLVKSFEGSRPGKLVALDQTIDFFSDHPSRLPGGNGMGNFSSRLAFRMTGLGFAGSYPRQFTTISPDFEKNHLAVYSHFFSRESKYHSVIHSPNSVFFQLFGEYGLLGLAAFFFLYICYFARRSARSGYGLPLLFLLLCFFTAEYWFEQLSIVVIFELMMFLHLKENTA
jgi:hypothetical protein